MADAAPDARYRIPAVFAEAHASGFAGLALAPNPDKLVDPVTGQPVAPEAYSPETVLERCAPNANKRASRSEIAELRARAERAVGADPLAVQAVIGGMPALLQTNSFHAANFWSRNWFLADRDAVEEAGRDYGVPCVRMWCYRRFIEGTAERMLGRLEEARPTPRRA